MKKLFTLLTLFLFSGILNAQALTVMTYNLRYDNPGDGPNAWPERKDFLAAQIRFNHPDVFGIQEGLKHQLEYLENVLPEYSYAGVGRDDGKEAGEYSAVFYKKSQYNLLKSGTFWLSRTPEKPSKDWDAALPRICTYVLLQDTSGHSFWFFNTHFDHMGEEARLQSAGVILNKIKEMNSQRLPVVLTGDFNCMPGSAPYEKLTEQLWDTRNLGQEPPFGPDGTFNGFVFEKPAENRIDHIFVSKGFTILRTAILSDNRNCRYPSDHFPVVAQMQFR